MKNNISGALQYKSDSLDLVLPVEYTGDYSQGLLVLIDELNKQVGSDVQTIKSQVLKDLQQWSKATDQKLSW